MPKYLANLLWPYYVEAARSYAKGPIMCRYIGGCPLVRGPWHTTFPFRVGEGQLERQIEGVNGVKSVIGARL